MGLNRKTPLSFVVVVVVIIIFILSPNDMIVFLSHVMTKYKNSRLEIDGKMPDENTRPGPMPTRLRRPK